MDKFYSDTKSEKATKSQNDDQTSRVEDVRRKLR